MTPDQIDAALCRQVDPDIFFPEGVGNRGLDAKSICRRCPSRLACLIDAIENDERIGIWGGFSEDKRRKITVATAAAAIKRDEDEAAAKQIVSAIRAERRKMSRTNHERWLKRCHVAYNAGERDDETIAGQREYDRIRKRASYARQKRESAA